MLQEAGERRLGYCQPVEIKPAEMPDGWTAVPTTLEEIRRLMPNLRAGQAATRTGLWNLAETLQDPEGYKATATPGIGADPVLRLFLRDEALESGEAVRGAEGTVAVTMDRQERNVLLEIKEGSSNAVRESREALNIALDLHAAHHFDAAAAVDGSMMEDGPPRYGRRVGFGVFEGIRDGRPVLCGAEG